MGIESFGVGPRTTPTNPDTRTDRTVAPDFSSDALSDSVDSVPLASVESESSSGSSADQLRTVESLERSVTTVRNGMRQVNDLLAKIGNVPNSPEISQKLALLGPKFDELAEIASQLSSTPEIQSEYSDAAAYLRARYDAEIASRVP